MWFPLCTPSYLWFYQFFSYFLCDTKHFPNHSQCIIIYPQTKNDDATEGNQFHSPSGRIEQSHNPKTVWCDILLIRKNSMGHDGWYIYLGCPRWQQYCPFRQHPQVANITTLYYFNWSFDHCVGLYEANAFVTMGDGTAIPVLG